MSTEEKITSNPETTELPKSKHRFKLDKRFIQGFIAGILLCTIAFTGFYYGTDGQFFSGDMSDTLPLVTDANFENEVLKSDRYVLVVTYIYDPSLPHEANEAISKQFIIAVKKLISVSNGRDRVKAVSLDVNHSSETIKAYNIPKVLPWILVFKDGECRKKTSNPISLSTLLDVI